VPAALEEWRQWTTGPITVRTVDGDHFFAGADVLPALVGEACREYEAADAAKTAASTADAAKTAASTADAAKTAASTGAGGAR
jgi:hypothetical protein